MITIKAFTHKWLEILGETIPEGEAKTMLSILMEEYLSLSRQEFLFLDKDTVLSTEVLSRLVEARNRLLSGEPLQYILGYAHFLGECIIVAPGVLIPRPETEELIHLIKKDLELSPRHSLKILDIGTGSACIPVGIAKQMGHQHITQIDALDISLDALAIAERNISSAQKVYPQITFRLIQQDIFKLPSEVTTSLGGYDVIISNPPYIHPQEAKEMADNVLDWEPHLALFTPEDEPTIYYTQIARLAQDCRFLRPGGSIYLEINPLYAKRTLDEMLSILEAQRNIQGAHIITDLSGKERFICINLGD